MEANKKNHSNRLRELRQRLGLSQKQVVSRIRGIDTPRLARYEKGELFPPLIHAMRLSFFYQQPLETAFPEIAQQVRAEILNNPLVIRSIRRRVYHAEEAQ